MKRAVLPKLWAWIFLLLLALLDSFLDMFFAANSGLKSFFWQPIAEFTGIKYAPLMVPFLLIIFFILVKLCAFLEKKIENVNKAEELVLTTLVVAYGLFNLWLILVYLFKFSLFRNPIHLIPALVVVAMAYAWWAERILKKEKDNKK